MTAARGMAIFIIVFIVIPWGLIFALRLVGHRRGYRRHRFATVNRGYSRSSELRTPY